MLWVTFLSQTVRYVFKRFCAVLPEATEFGEMTQNKGHYDVQGHDFGTNQKLIRLPISD